MAPAAVKSAAQRGESIWLEVARKRPAEVRQQNTFAPLQNTEPDQEELDEEELTNTVAKVPRRPQEARNPKKAIIGKLATQCAGSCC